MMAAPGKYLARNNNIRITTDKYLKNIYVEAILNRLLYILEYIY